MADLSPTEFLSEIQAKTLPDVLKDVPTPTPPVSVRDPEAQRERDLKAQGKVADVPFHEEGLGVWTTLMAKARDAQESQLRYLAGKFGAENVRLNELNEPVVRSLNPESGQMEDYPLNSKKMTLANMVSLARFAPEVLGGILAVELGGPARGAFVRSVLGAVGSESGGLAKDISLQTSDVGPAGFDINKPIMDHLINVPIDIAFDLGLGGLIKSGQIVKNIAVTRHIPNPLAGSPLLTPADPVLTSEGVKAAARNLARSGIDPALRPSESSGIPLMAMLEQYMERKPAGATPMIAGKIRREDASKAFQTWLIDPSTLASDEEVGRRGLTALRRTVEPFQKDVDLLQFAKEAEEKGAARLAESTLANAKTALQSKLVADQRAKILSGMRVTDIPDQGVRLSETGDLLRSKFIQARDEFKAQSSKLYDEFFSNPKSKERIISGDQLKGSIDALRAELPAVSKDVEAETGLLDQFGNPLTETTTANVPISTPIRSRLDELSSKLEDGKVSINDLKQIRTDLDNAITIGEAVPGVKEGRLKATYKAVSDAITAGLGEIGDPQLSQAWKDATTFYRQNVGKFTEKNVARLAKEAEQSGSVGNAEFTKKAITSEDAYAALKSFYGLKSPEMGAFRTTVKNKVLADSLGVGDLVDGNNLVRALSNLRDTNPDLYKDVFAGKGNDFLRAAEQLGSFQQKLPLEEAAKLLSPTASSGVPSVKLIALQAAQKRLGEEYQNEVISKFLKGSLPLDQLQPDKFVSFLPQAKLSDVRDVMARLQSEAPDVAEQIRRKSVQNLLSESRRTPQPRDTMAKLMGEPGDLISGTGISNALGSGDQLEKYKALLGNLYEPLVDYAKTELLGEERRRVAAGVGMLAPGSAMNAFIKALTPWEGGNKPEGIIKEMSGLARDKVVSIVLSSDALRNWLVSPHGVGDASNAIKIAIMSEPFLKGMLEEFKDEGSLQKAMSILKVGFGTADTTRGEQKRDMSEEDFRKAIQTSTLQKTSP